MAGRHRIGPGLLAALVAAGLPAGTGTARAQPTAEPVLAGAIVEVFDRTVRTSAVRGALVGVVLGDPAPGLAIDTMRGVIPAGMPASQLCFAATTADGIYSARGAVTVPAGAHGRLRIVGTSTASERYPRFAGPLAAYRQGQFAGLLVASPDCASTRSAEILAVSFGEGAGQLSVAVNSQGALKLDARLGDSAGKRVNGDCRPMVDQRTTAFDHVCAFRMTGLDFSRGPATLELLSVPAAGPKRRESYRLRLPG